MVFSKNKIIPIITITVLLAAFIFSSFFMETLDKRHNPIGYRNVDICSSIQPGIGLPDLIEKLGDPISKFPISNGISQYSFQTGGFFRAGDINANVNEKTGKVYSLDCDCEGPPDWEIQ